MSTIKYNNGKEWIDVHTTYKSTETTHGVAKIATSQEVLEGLNDESIVTPKKLQEVVATLPVEAEVVHKDGEEVITGLKTFSGNDAGVGKVIFNNPTLSNSADVDSTPQFGGIEFTDKDNVTVGMVDAIRGIDGEKLYNAIRLTSANGDDIVAHTPLELRTYDNGKIVAVGPTPSENADSIELVTAEWVNDKFDDEAGIRKEEDDKLTGLINAETSARETAVDDLQGQINKEIDDRVYADGELQKQIDQEIEFRTSADNNLQGQINTNASAIATINTNITNIQGDITEINEALETKQDNLTEDQLKAVNSGVTSATVTQVATNVSNILDLQTNKADITYVDGEVDKLEQSIASEVSTLNTRIDNEVKDIEDAIASEVETINGRIDSEVDTLEQSITTNVNTINGRIDSEVATLNSAIDLKADKSDTYTKAEVDAKVTSVYRFKGTVETIEELPSENNVEGDVYNVKETGENFAWVGPKGDVAGFWDDLGGDIDLTPYLTKAEASTTYETIANVNALSTSLNTKIDEVEQSLETSVQTINTRIDNEVSTLNTTITTKENELKQLITTNVETLNKKIDDEVDALEQAISLKADKETTYTKTEVDALVSPKADKTYVDGHLELKADKTYVDSEVDTLEQSITTNVNTINGRIDSEVETINDRIDSEVSTLNDAVALKADKTYVDEQNKTLDEKIDSEVSTLNTRIDNEVKDIEDAIALKADTTYVDSEVDTLEQAIASEVSTLNTRIDNEVSTLNTTITNSVNTINGRIDSEVDTLEQAIALKADTTYVDGQLELKADKLTTYTKTQVDALLEPKATTEYVDGEVDKLEQAISLKADTTYVDGEVDKLEQAISLKADKETTYTKTEVDNLLSPKATTEYVDGEVDKLEQAIASEVETINGRIDNEVKDLEDAIDLKADKTSIGDATVTFQKNGAEVGKFTTNQSTNATINIEVATKVSELTNDSKYQTEEEVEAVATEIRGLITAEETARSNADNTLQTQIDAINARRDVVDILATYEELETYPTTDLTDKDIVKVIDDSSHNNTSSYFRWDATSSEWSYVGSEAATYTKAESDEKYALKSTTINGKSLEANVTLTYSDVNALSDTTKYAKSLEASGRTITLKDQDGTVLSTITTQDTTYTAGDGIQIDENNKIINTKVSAVWGNIEGTLADQEDLVDALELKADKSTTYTKTEVDNLLSPKATTEYVDGQIDLVEQSIASEVETINNALSLKADKTEIPTKVSELENDSGYLTEHQDISGKADITYVDSELAKKADKSTTYTKTEVDNLLSPKATTEYVDGEVDKLEQAIALKSDITYVDGEVDKLEQAISLKADITYVDGQLELKADKETTYTKTEVDALVEPKADKTYVDGELVKKATITYVDGEVDKLEEVIATKATKSNSLEGYGIADAYTKDEVDELIENIDALPSQSGNAGKALITDGSEAKWDYTTLVKNHNDGTQYGSSQLVINKLSQEKYNELVEAGQISDDELYITIDDREFYTKDEVDEKIDNKVDSETYNSAIEQLQTNIDLKADKSDTYTKAEVDAKVTSVYRFKGNVASASALPTEGNVVGDVYNVEDTGDNYAWTEDGWDKLSGTIDLTAYLMKEEASTTYETIANVNALADVVDTKADASAVYTKTEVDEIVENIDALPTQIDNAGKFLTTDGENASWSAIDTIFWANYGTTTFAEIYDKAASGKLVVCKYSGYITTLSDIGSTSNLTPSAHIFSTIFENYKIDIKVTPEDKWSFVAQPILPGQSGNEGKVLTTNGTEAKWEKFYPGVIRVWE